MTDSIMHLETSRPSRKAAKAEASPTPNERISLSGLGEDKSLPTSPLIEIFCSARVALHLITEQLLLFFTFPLLWYPFFSELSIWVVGAIAVSDICYYSCTKMDGWMDEVMSYEAEHRVFKTYEAKREGSR